MKTILVPLLGLIIASTKETLKMAITLSKQNNLSLFRDICKVHDKVRLHLIYSNSKELKVLEEAICTFIEASLDNNETLVITI